MKFKILFLILPVAIAFVSCKKSNQTSLDVSSIFVINAATDVGAIRVNTSSRPISWLAKTDQIAYGANKFYYGPVGSVPITVVSAVDTTKLLFNKRMNLQHKMVYSMYIFGTDAAIDTMFRAELNYPIIPLRVGAYDPVDSVVNVRFVNLAYGSPALSINIKDNPVNEVTNLSYKGISPFKGYASKQVRGATNYEFEIRNAATNVVLANYTFQATITNQFKNVALVIMGVFGSTTDPAPFEVREINYF